MERYSPHMEQGFPGNCLPGIKTPPCLITKLYTNFVMESTDISLALTLCGYGDCDKFITHKKVPCTTFFMKKLYMGVYKYQNKSLFLK